MKMFALCIGMMLMSATAYAKEMVVTVKGQQHTIQVTTMNREITPQDRTGGNQNSALGCAQLVYSHLAADQIDKASRLTTDPNAARKMWTQYRERLGVDDFKKIMDEFFTAKNVIRAEIVKGATHMLVVQAPDDTPIVQLYLNKNGSFTYVSAPTTDEEKVLGKMLNLIQDGSLKLE